MHMIDSKPPPLSLAACDASGITRLLLVRHGESVTNLTNAFSCLHVDYPLTAEGVLQARETATMLRHSAPRRIFTSPLRRARETAAILAEGCGISTTVVEDFREVNVGDLEREPPSDEAWALHDRIVKSWAQGNAFARFPSGEDYRSLLLRFRRGLLRVCAETGKGTGVVVGHGGIFGYTMKDICPDMASDLLEHNPIRNCSITEITPIVETTGLFRLMRWAECSHLNRLCLPSNAMVAKHLR